MKSLFAIVLSAVLAVPAWAQDYRGPLRPQGQDATDQIIVKWRSGAKQTLSASTSQRASKLSTRSGQSMRHKRRSTPTTEVFKLDRRMSGAELQAVLDRLNADPDVEFAVADKRRQIQALPSDPLFDNQWYFKSIEVAATRTDQAWDIVTGRPEVDTVVAVLDTGVLPDHPDLMGKVLEGFDFISNELNANDSDGWDSDATDPGDWLEQADRTQNPSVFGGCALRSSSSWHGTRVSGLIAAASNEGAGMAGAAWDARILPVRVLGKCGGDDSDIIDGMRWAAGLPVDGAPLNPTPASIINMSLGGNEECNAAYQSAVDEITAAGTLIVASVGNEGIPVGVPANCNGVLGVSGVRHAGTKVGYSNLGTGADIAAPAGNCINEGPPFSNDAPCVYHVQVPINSSTRGPDPAGNGHTDAVSRVNFGTSFAAPMVAGAAALMHEVNPALTPAQFTTLLRESATPFPTSSDATTLICRVPTTFVQGYECICTTLTCGAGMLNTFAAVQAALKPFGIVQSTATIEPNVAVNISGSTSFGAPGRTVSSYQWSVLDVTGATPTIVDTTAASTTLQVSGNSRFTLRLRVTDDVGTIDDTDFAMVTSTPPEPQTPPASTPIGTGDGGGGNFDWWLLVLGLLPLALPGPRRRKVANSSTGRGHRRRRRNHFPE
ncbi:S8 family peptidase [Steroidobacter sp. S1-65]|uniref:S8 family peptidase n=1 Tax=Steroidobacter gossypii TaxID=2805490 RepID=A0ABS1WWH7_9GAMM|nr:S8 family peptidase [Steroidobacter gossypii]MBM0105326.1 S8 family peptidase [Steroidobacter gossypii]